MKRVYFNPHKTPHGMLVCSPDCEHCDGASYGRRPLVRHDYFRGWVCPFCDSAIDAMEREARDPTDAYYEADVCM